MTEAKVWGAAPIKVKGARAWTVMWNEVAREAAREHPNWEVTTEGRLRWLGGKGPRTPQTLLNWYLRHSPGVHERIAKRMGVIDKFLDPEIWGELKGPSSARH